MQDYFQGISYRLAKIGVVVALIVGCILSALEIYIDYKSTYTDINAQINRISEVSTPPAKRAIATLDKGLAEEVSMGLLRYPFITAVTITNETGLTLFSDSREEIKTDTQWLTNLLSDSKYKTYKTRLSISQLDDSAAGEMMFLVNMDFALQPFYRSAALVISLGLIRSCLLVFFLFLIFHQILAKPLIRLVSEIKEIDFEKPGQKRLTKFDNASDQDELSQLIFSSNQLLDSVDKAFEKRKSYEIVLQKSEKHIRQIIDGLPIWVGARNESGHYIFANKALAEFLRIEPDRMRGMHLNDFQAFYQEDIQVLADKDKKVIHGELNDHMFEETLMNAEGQEHKMNTHILPMEFYDETVALLVSSDITELKQAQAKMEHMAYHDPLTALPNRSYLMERLEEEVRKAKNYDYLGALLFIDLDQFKYINDSLGHPAGDIVLKHVAERLTAITKENDVVVRLGGDEFVVVLSNLGNNLPKAILWVEQIAERIRAFISEPHFYSDLQLHVSCSVGVVMFPEADDNSTVHDLLSYADAAMYQVKEQGRNSIKFFDKNMTDKARNVLVLEDELHKALDRGQFSLFYQPRVNVRTSEVVGAEALLRWHHPERGMIPPGEFISVLEASGFIIDVGMWVLEEALRQVEDWIDRGIWHDGMRMGVNISPRQFRSPTFVKQVLALIDEKPFLSNALEIEITEGIVIHNFDETIDKMHLLRDKGVHFSLDDFGTGYSSISYLKQLPVSVLKIDQSFVRDITVDRNDRILVETISAMGNMLGLEVVAEGVEIIEQLKLVREYGCLYYQGYYCSRPVPAENFEKFIEDPDFRVPDIA